MLLLRKRRRVAHGLGHCEAPPAHRGGQSDRASFPTPASERQQFRKIASALLLESILLAGLESGVQQAANSIARNSIFFALLFASFSEHRRLDMSRGELCQDAKEKRVNREILRA